MKGGRILEEGGGGQGKRVGEEVGKEGA